MQEWIIAMLVVSILLILRDMAKTVFSGKTKEKEEMLPLCESHPQKEKVERYAASFRKLADTFYGMPYRKEFLSGGQLNRIISDTSAAVCSRCYQREICWGERAGETMRGSENMIRTMEEGNEESIQRARSEWMGACGRSAQYFQVLNEGFREERQNLVWDNRMIESRLAVAQQLTEISRIMDHMAEELYDIMPADPQFQEDLKKALRKKHVLVKNVWVMDKIEGRRQIFLNLRARSGQCVSMTEIAQILSQDLRKLHDAGRRQPQYCKWRFSYGPFCGGCQLSDALRSSAAYKRSGKGFRRQLYLSSGRGWQVFLCLSDGMGSGIEAFKESEIVVELLEQFLESGFSQETAARMVNSALLLKGREGMFSTVDICAVDLYTGICDFLKAGASSTFIKRDHWVESIASENLAAGLVQQLDFDTASRKLYHGDYLIMMTDGVLDALPTEREEETMKEIIMDVREKEPREMGRGILERVLGYSDYHARDDMTVVVAGLWKK